MAPEPSVNIYRWAVAAADASAVIEAIYGVEDSTLGLVALAIMVGRRSAPTVHLTDERDTPISGCMAPIDSDVARATIA